jgi:hypothetical protein
MTCSVCDKVSATTECRGLSLCLGCHVASRLAFQCEHFTVTEALELNDQHNASGAAKEILAKVATLMEPTEGQKKMAARKTTANNGKLPAGVPKGAVARDRYEDKLPCKSDDAIVATKARELARLEHQRTVFRESWKAQCAKTRERRAFFEERIEELATEVNGEVEYKNVEVQEYLLPTNEVIAVRLDTMEIIDTRTAEAEDLQDRIPGADEGKPKKPRGKGKRVNAEGDVVEGE